MLRLLRPLARRVTYTRWLHLMISTVVFGVWLFISEKDLYIPVIALGLLGLLPAMRMVEGLQARLLLSPYGYRDDASGIAVTSSATWADRWRTVLWLQLRLALGLLTGRVTVALLGVSTDLALTAGGGIPDPGSLLPLPGGAGHWWYALLVPVPIALLLAAVVGLGELMTLLARRLLGQSAAERLAALEERTEQLLERNRIARELHDSIGHALTVAVVQAGAARAAGSPEFTERALAAIEETGRAALEDLERVLLVLRESGQRPAGGRPTLADADRLLESARASGAALDAEVTGPLAQVPGPVSREGYRIVQEALTNVLRHAGPVPTRVRIAVASDRLELDVRNPIAEGAPAARAGNGSGLRGIRERAALLGGEAAAGPHGGEWRVTVGLPLDGPR
ncbi:sensor histidine kinase [Streptomyces sp. t39]|uniref:sensor histidine kinase n=1 Tax=Streptomyces sp. t39 TaxID=1828156 RepID=UPI0011CE3E2A|nr:histidine kinase [Streptomyces sp. t39]TXS55277.1 two-component sensor histidine kinase [Streptomyces sp. t39]